MVPPQIEPYVQKVDAFMEKYPHMTQYGMFVLIRLLELCFRFLSPGRSSSMIRALYLVVNSCRIYVMCQTTEDVSMGVHDDTPLLPLATFLYDISLQLVPV